MMMVSIDERNNNNNANIIHSPSGKSDIIEIDIKEESMDASIENGGNDDERNCTSLESADYLGLLDPDNDNDPINGKRYFCQRCLNHGLEFQRKGHKPTCKYATCKCELCMMVEQRRQINYQLSIRKPDDETCDSIINGRKIRKPKCARCSAHGQKQALRGHKKATCPFNHCECDMCALVENRRVLMARQIRVRRNQQRQRLQQTSETTPEPVECDSVLKRLLKPQPQQIVPVSPSPPNNEKLISKLSIQSLSKTDTPKRTLGHTRHQSAFRSAISMSIPKSTNTEVTTVSNESTDISHPQFPHVPPGLFTPAQMEFIMKLFMQASQQQQQLHQHQPPSQQQQTSQHLSPINGIPLNPFIFNHHHSHSSAAATAAILPQHFINNNNNINSQIFSHHLFTGFPNSPSSSTSTSSPATTLTGATMPSMVNPFLFSCFPHGFLPTAQIGFPPFLATTEQRPS